LILKKNAATHISAIYSPHFYQKNRKSGYEIRTPKMKEDVNEAEQNVE
jgi:hypothetical protein